MAKGQFLSSYQKSIVNRYYANTDARIVNALQELVSEIAVAETESAKSRLWKRAAEHLAKTTIDAKKSAAVVAAKDVKAFAELVAQLSASPNAIKSDKPAPRAPRPSAGDDDL